MGVHFVFTGIVSEKNNLAWYLLYNNCKILQLSHTFWLWWKKGRTSLDECSGEQDNVQGDVSFGYGDPFILSSPNM